MCVCVCERERERERGISRILMLRHIYLCIYKTDLGYKSPTYGAALFTYLYLHPPF